MPQLPTGIPAPDSAGAAPKPPVASKPTGADREALDSVWGPLVEAVDPWLPGGAAVAHDVLLTVVLFVVLWGVRRAALSVIRRRVPDDPGTFYRWRKSTSYALVAVGVIAMFGIWSGESAPLGTFLGLLTAGVAIALKDPLVDLAGWLFMLWRKPFATGDRVTIREHTGDVIDQRAFQFTLLEVGTATGAGQSTGRIVHVPNGWVFTSSVVNHTGTFAYVWHEVAVVVTFESDWRAAKQILTEVAAECADHLSADAERTLRQAAREYYIFYSKLTPVVYTSVVGEGVQLTLRYLVAPRRVRGSEQDVWEAVLDRFAARDDVDLAYPTTRLYRNDLEGKPGAGGPPRRAEQVEGEE